MRSILGFCLLTGFIFCSPASHGQTVPGTLSYQGILMQSDGITPVSDGSHSIVFDFYDAASGGNLETSRTVSVTTTKGLFTCILGDGAAGGSALPSALGTKQIYIEIKVDGGAPLSPRARLTPSLYAFQAQSSYTISDNAVTTVKIADGAVTNIKLASGIDASKITLGTLDAARLPASTLTGAGTSGNIPFWTGTTTFGNDAGLFWDNSANKRLGIGTITPATRIHVVGTNAVSGDDDIAVESIGSVNPSLQLRKAQGIPTAPTTVLANDVLGRLSFQGYTGSTSSVAAEVRSIAETDFSSSVNGALSFRTTSVGTQNERMRITSTGNVGIGVSSPSSRLHLSGNANILRLEGLDHSFIEFYPDGPTTRKGYIGFAGATDNDISIRNEISGADIKLSPTSGEVLIQSSLDVNGSASANGMYSSLGSSSSLELSALYGSIDDDGEPPVIQIAPTDPERYGLQTHVRSNKAGATYGLYSTTYNNSTGPVYGGRFYTNTIGTGTVYGLYVDSNKASGQSGTLYGLRVESDNDGTGNSYLMYANSVGATTGTEYGLYISGEDVNYFGGKVGMGTSSLTTIGTYKLYIIGSGFASGGTWQASDVRYKKEFKKLTSSLDKILNIEGFSYEWNREENPEMEFPEGRHYGFKAQEIEKYFPELITTHHDGYKAMNYAGMSPILLEAIKEQQSQIDVLTSVNKNLEQRLLAIEALLQRQPSTGTSNVKSEK